MVKLVAVYRKPADVAAFDQYFAEIHAPLARKMPGLRRLEVARITGAPGGDSDLHQIVDMYFDSADDLQAALASPEGRAAGKDVGNFARRLVSLHIAEVG